MPAIIEKIAINKIQIMAISFLWWFEKACMSTIAVEYKAEACI